MTLRQYTLDAGPAGTNLTDANSGSTAGSTPSGSSITFDASSAGHGPFGALSQTDGVGVFRRWEFDTPNTVWAASFVITLPSSPPPTTIQFVRFRTASGTVLVALNLDVNGKVTLITSGRIDDVVTGLSWGDKYRFTLVVTGGLPTSSQATAKVYSGVGVSGWNTQVGSTFSSSSLDIANDPATRVELGVPAATTGAVAIGFDDIQIDDGRTTEIPDLTGAEPTLQVDTWTPSYKIIDFSGSSAGSGGSLSFVFTPSAGVVDLGGARYGFPQTTEAVNYQVVVTESGSGMQDSAIVTVPAVTTGTADYTGYTQTVVYDGSAWS